MAFVTKTWKDRLVEFSGRRKLKNISTEEEIIYDVSRSEGTIMQVGDQFSAENMNNLEQRIKTEFDSVNSSLDDCKIISEGEGENTKYYLQKGADTASKKLLGKSTLYIKTGLFHDGGSNVYACTYISEDNKNWVEICKTPTVVHNFGSNVWKWSGTYTYGEN